MDNMWRLKHIIHASWVTRWEHKKPLLFVPVGQQSKARSPDKKGMAK